jgi:hypothetical protein
MREFIKNNKTKITGVAIAILGALQASSGNLVTLLTPHQYALLMVFVGVGVSALGFLNSQASK